MSGLFGGKTINNSEQAVGTLRINASSQGLPIPIVFGLTRIPSNMLDYFDFTPVPHTESQTAGKGGGTTVNNTSYTYTTGIILGLSEGPITTVGQVWKNKDITTTGNLGLTLFEGNYPQAPWSFMTTNHANHALGYLGTAYLASAALDLGSSASTPNFSFEVGGFYYTGCPDINPALVLDGILTGAHYGAGFPEAFLGDLTAFATYCSAAGFLIAPAYTAQRSAADIVTELADIGNSGIVWSEGQLKLIPYAEEAVTGNATTGSIASANEVTIALFNLGNAADETTFGHDLTTIGAGAGLSGGALVCTGTADSYALGGPYSTFDIGANFKLQGRVTLPDSQPNQFPTIFTLFSDDHSDYIMLRFDRESHLDRFELFAGYAGGLTAYSTDAFGPGTYHWEVQCSGGAMALWIEGERQTSDLAVGGISPGDLELMLGGQPAGSSGNTPNSASAFDGSLLSFKATTGTGAVEESFTPESEPLQLDGATTAYTCEVTGEVTFTPDLSVRYSLTYDDFLGTGDPVKVTRKRQADAYNQVQIECLNRADNYNSVVVDAKDDWNIDLYGLRPQDPINVHAICDPAVARAMAEIKKQRALYQRNNYEFTLGWRYARLEPMDIVAITDPEIGADELPVRVRLIEEDENGELHVTAEDLFIGVSSAAATAANYSALVQAAGGYVPNAAVDPGDTHAPVIFMPPAAASGGVNQVWIGAAGGAQWGGAQVWVSSDGDTYQQEGTLTAPARYGVLSANFPSAATPDTTSTLSVDLSTSNGTLTGATSAAADALSTLSYIGPQASRELVAYSAANLTAPNEYDLDTYIVRGSSGTTPAAHAAGADFLRLDDAVARFDVPDALLGTTIYIKLPAYNLTGGGAQDLADATAYPFNIPVPAAANGTTTPTSTTAAALLTLERGILKAQRVGDSYVGLRADGAPQFNPQVLYKLSATAGSLQATSFDLCSVSGYWTDLVAGAGSNLIVAAYNAPVNVYTASNVYRIDASGNLSTSAASYGHNAPLTDGIVRALAYDGADVWTAEVITGKLVRLNAGNLAAQANYSLAGLANATTCAMDYAGGSLYVAVNDTTPELVKWDTTGHAVTWNVAIVEEAAAVVVSGNLVFVTGESGVSVRSTANGAEVNNVAARAGEAYRFGNASVLVNDYPQVNSGGDSRLLLLDAATGNLSRTLDIPLTFLSGTDSDIILVADSPTNDYRDYRTYLYRLFLTDAVTEVGLNLPATVFNTGANVSAAGNLTGTFVAQNANSFFAGPTTGNACTPSFRAIVVGDIPPGANTQVLTTANGAAVWANFSAGIGSVALSMPAIFSVANSPLTSNGTLAVSLANQSAALVWAGPTSGNAAAPTFRNLVAADFGNGVVASTFLAGPSSGANANASFRALVGGDMPPLTINTQTANYTLALSDANIAYLRMNSANATVVTVPANANVSYANGTNVLINRAGAGNVTINGAANVTVNNSSSNTIRAQHSTVALVYTGADVWDLFGDLT